MKTAEKLDTASSVFFLFGFVVSQLKHSPFALLSALSNIGALFFYSIGYTLWLCACQLYPDYPRQKESWYGFTGFKNQHRVAALIGGLAIVCCLIGIIIPEALVAASWLYFISNCVWSIGEYHKQRNPPNFDKNYSSTQQSAYVRYALVTTLITLTPAVTATISLFFPPAALLAFVVSATLGLCLGSLSLYCWVDYTFNEHKPDKKGSYDNLVQRFGITPNQLTSSPSDQPPSVYNLWQPNSSLTSAKPLTPPSSDVSNELDLRMNNS